MKFTDTNKKKVVKNHLRIISMKSGKHKHEIIIFSVPKNIHKNTRSVIYFIECIGITCKRYFMSVVKAILATTSIKKQEQQNSRTTAKLFSFGFTSN